MHNFNLLISSPRYNEVNAKAELWFSLLICGDTYPIISDLEFQGLITALTTINEFDFIRKMKLILSNDPFFYKYILKIIPIQFLCETNLNIIKSTIDKNITKYLKKNESFRIILNRRKNSLIKREGFMQNIAKNIDNPVDLENPDKIIHIEVLDNICGISFLKQEDIIRPNNSMLMIKNSKN
ncbi:MAG: THUMP domain-containing protein [Candidatus Lokiarchaeota archaeon]|nr:THUMP domain-containing protein [Candidatus Lokiarchaeota archaeon]